MSKAMRKRLSNLRRQQQSRLRNLSGGNHLGMESLEDRLLLAADAGRDATGQILVTDVALNDGVPTLDEAVRDSFSFAHTDDSLTLLSNSTLPLDLRIGLQGDQLSVWDAGQLIVETPFDNLTQISVAGSAAYDDVLAIDFNTDVPLDIVYEGGDGGYDVLDLSGVRIGSYTPGAVFGDGVITAGLSTITFTGLEPVTIDGGTVNGASGDVDTASIPSTFTFTSPHGADSILIDSMSAGTNRISGTSGGVSFEEVIFSNIQDVIIDLGANDSAEEADDVVTIGATIEATGLNSLAIQAGTGADELRIEAGEIVAENAANCDYLQRRRWRRYPGGIRRGGGRRTGTG